MIIPSVHLRFDLPAVLALAEDAAAASWHRTRLVYDADTQTRVQVDAGPCLILVRDHGVYLMSSRARTLPGDTGTASEPPLVYADGFHPDHADWHAAWDETRLPGDDFAEYLHLFEDELIDHLRTAHRHHYRYFTITVTENDLRLGFTG